MLARWRSKNWNAQTPLGLEKSVRWRSESLIRSDGASLGNSSSHACLHVASRQSLRRRVAGANGSSGLCRLRLAQVVGPVAARPALQRRCLRQTRFRAGRACLGVSRIAAAAPLRPGAGATAFAGPAAASCPGRCRFWFRQRHRPSAPPAPGAWRQRRFRGLPGSGLAAQPPAPAWPVLAQRPLRGPPSAVRTQQADQNPDFAFRVVFAPPWLTARSALAGWRIHFPVLLALGPGRPLPPPWFWMSPPAPRRLGRRRLSPVPPYFYPTFTLPLAGHWRTYNCR